jgi:aminodeoxyfutalosine synthase
MKTISEIFAKNINNNQLLNIAQKVDAGKRITDADALYLFNYAPLPYLGALANSIQKQRHGDIIYFNRNFHIEPTNVCVFSCNFCAYSRVYAHREEGWELTIDQMLDQVKKYDGIPVTEVHIVGGVHPKMDLKFFASLLEAIKKHRTDLHIKAFTRSRIRLYVQKSEAEY